MSLFDTKNTTEIIYETHISQYFKLLFKHKEEICSVLLLESVKLQCTKAVKDG